MKVEKALMRISKELLLKYNPKFYKAEVFKKFDPIVEIEELLKQKNISYESLSLENKKSEITNTNKKESYIPLVKEIRVFIENLDASKKSKSDKKEILRNIDIILSKISSDSYFNEEIVNKLDPNENKILQKIKEIFNDKEIPIQNLLEKVYKDQNEINNNSETEFDKERLDTLLANKIKEFINDQVIPYKDKKEMLDLIDHISNTLIVINEEDEKYEDDHILARDVLEMFDREISKEHQKKLKDFTILDRYIDKFKANLKLNKNLKQNENNRTLFGYHYNIFGYNFLGDKTRLFSNKFFGVILRLLSTWLLFSKPFGSSWLFSSYISTSAYGYKKLFTNLTGKLRNDYKKSIEKELEKELEKENIDNNYINKLESQKKKIESVYSIRNFGFLQNILEIYWDGLR